MKETASKEVIEVGYNDHSKKTITYATSELRLMEVLHDPSICRKLSEYQLHKERKDSSRFAKGVPETFKTLQSLVNRGVEVKMDIPQELWNETSVETSSLVKQCEPLLSAYEDDLEEWFFHRQNEDIKEYLCRDRVLTNKDNSCLDDVHPDEMALNKHQSMSSEPKNNKLEL